MGYHTRMPNTPALTPLHVDPSNSRKWVYQCSCGTVKPISKYAVDSGRVKSCGCLRKQPRDTLVPGTRFGKLVVMGRHSTTRNGHVKWTCRCDCGSEKGFFGTHLKQGGTTSCGCDRVRHGPRHVQWAGCGEISGNFFDQIKRSAAGKGGRGAVPLTVTIEYLWDLFVRQNRRCALSGLSLTFKSTSHDDPQTASLDRIDGSKGYEPGNVQWVHKDVNRMKNVFDQQHFIAMCRDVARTHPDQQR